MEQVVPAAWNAEYTTNWSGPLDGQTIDPDDLPGVELFPWQITSDNPWWNRPLKLGEIGCAVSHWMCWVKARQANADRILVLEDDVKIVDDCDYHLTIGLKTLTKLDPTWELVYLGRWLRGTDMPFADGFVRPGYSFCTFGYLLNADGLDKVLAAGFEQALIPVDEFLPALYMDHPRADVRERYHKCLNAYAFEPPLVTQLPKDEAGSDTEASEFLDGVVTGPQPVKR
jgi:collagen beta-1,O-galactosyltransferase